MALIWVGTYSGVPPAEAFSSTQGFGTPIIVNTVTGIGYYYQDGVGVTAINSPGASGVSDHGALTGLLDDDHPQYHNDARGDLRYTPLSHKGLGGTTEHPIVTHTVAGFMDPADKILLDAGIDAWTYVYLTADETVSSTTAATTLLTFTPAAEKHYIVEGQLFVSTSDATNGPCPGVSWPTGLDIGAISMRVPNSSTASSEYHFDNSAPGRAVSTGIPANQFFPSELNATFITGVSPSGDFTITISSEV